MTGNHYYGNIVVMALSTKQAAYHERRRNQTHCKRGHEFTTENTIMHSGSRHCRTCLHLRMRVYRAATPEKQRETHKAWLNRNPDYRKPQHIGSCTRCARILPLLGSPSRCQTCYLIVRKEVVKIALLKQQGERCAIAGCITDTSAYGLKDWHLDHNHSCGPAGHWCQKCVRGVLCKGCNAALGMAHESVETLQGMIVYLLRGSL